MLEEPHPSLPNLFSYATSELSQDAVLAWLAAWAAPGLEQHNPDLHRLGRGFLRKLMGGRELVIERIQVDQQVGGIDVLIQVGVAGARPRAILIEDKKGTREHGNQLTRYREHVLSLRAFGDGARYEAEDLVLVYFQAYDQADYKNVEALGYTVLRVSDMLELLEAHRAAVERSEIVEQFFLHLEGVHEELSRWQTSPFAKWSDSYWPWFGFFRALQESLLEQTRWTNRDGSLGYISNPRGGFMGMWWWIFGDEEKNLYLQLQGPELHVKMSFDDKGKGARRAQAEKAREHLLRIGAELGFPFVRPSRARVGGTTTLVVDGRALEDGGISFELAANGRVALEATARRFELAMRVVERCAGELGFTRPPKPKSS